MQRSVFGTLLGCLALLTTTGVLLSGCAGFGGRGGGANWREQGLASWYGADFHGRRTANGERYNMYAMTAAHKTLPLGTKVVVIHQQTGRRIRVRINDRGPFVAGRIIDLSLAAARALGSVGAGIAPVTVEAVLPPSAFANRSIPGSLPERAGSGVPATAETAPPAVPVEIVETAEPAATRGQRPLSPQMLQGSFAVQVGAFAVESNARELAARLPAPAGTTRVLPFEDNRGTWWRVRVGGYESELDAETAAAAFEESGLATFVVRED